MTTTRFENIDVGEMFKRYGITYTRIDPVTDGDGDDWNAINLDHGVLAFFYNEDWVDRWGK